MVTDIKIVNVNTKEETIFQDVPKELTSIIFKMLDNWNKTSEDD